MNKRFKPQFLPYNDDAHALVEALAVELGLTLYPRAPRLGPRPFSISLVNSFGGNFVPHL